MIYLDHNATTPMHPEVLTAMLPYMRGPCGNPASVHHAGRAARQGMDQARRQVASLIGVHDSLVCFTSGATEANNLAILGVGGMQKQPGHAITSRTEHPSVLEAFGVLQQQGHRVTYLDCDSEGRIAPESLQSHVTPDTFLVSIMHANNETGVIQPIAALADMCRKQGVLFHTDVVQSIARLPWDKEAMAADLITLSSHKLGGPMGVGALIMDRTLALTPMIVGGGQERGRRAGTPNVAGIVGFGAAADWLNKHRQDTVTSMTRLHAFLETSLTEKIPGLVIFSHHAPRIANTTLLGIDGLHGETLVMNLDLVGFSVSSGSACASGKGEGSHVLAAMGVPQSLALSAIRISIGWNTQVQQLERFIHQFAQIVARLQGGATVR
ncbi:MAG: cysteine desulfurase [Magnetococcales bacterium]|nr:cysteine desulfurase [Magnetococcales bacterium]